MSQTLRRIGSVLLAGWLAASAFGATPEEPDLVGTVVDEAGKSVPDVTVRGMLRAREVETKSSADGSFRIPLPANPQATGRVWGSLLGLAPDGRVGMLAVRQADGKWEPVKLVVKPSRELAVVVVDRAGKPVGGAEVDFLNGMFPIISGRSDDAGRWALKVPADATAWTIIGRKGGVGFDYATAERARDSKADPLPLPGEVKLTLDGARPIRVKVVDNAGKPMAGANVGPWLFQKPEREADINLGGMLNRWPATGPDGTIVLGWWPDIPKYTGSLLVHSEGYYVPDHAIWLKPDKPAEEVTITVFPLERLSGRVTGLDGKPAAGVKVEFQGQGAGSNQFSGSRLTDADGQFEAKVYSEQAYIVTATLGNLAAPYREDVVVRAGKAADGVDLVLGKATKIRGRVTVGKDDRPQAKAYVTLVISKGRVPAEFGQSSKRASREISFRTWVETDAAGRYEFLVGPGEYKVEGPARVDPTQVLIPAEDPPAEMVVDLKMPRPETGPFTVTVVDAQGKPIAGTTVDGTYASIQARSWFHRQKTDEKGTFQVERSLDPIVLQASSADGKLGGIIRSEAEATEARIVVGPLATATGRLLDTSGKPVPKRKLNWAIQVHMGEDTNSPWTNTFGGSVETDDKGQFTLAGLVPEHEYYISLPMGDNGSARGVTELTAKSAGPFDLGDVTVNLEPYKPYVPPTAQQRTAEAFTVRAQSSPKERLEAMLPEAKREYTRPLLLFGKGDDPACIELFRLFNEPSPETEDDSKDASKKPPTPAQLRWEFELMSLDTDKPEVRQFAQQFGTEVGEGHPPSLVVLDADGKVTASYPLQLDDAKKLDGPALARFLAEHKLATRDAEKMLADALVRAKAEDKRVFLIASASWCGPCRMLARFLAPRKGDLDPHFLFVKLDISRDLHAQTLLERFPDAANGGVPWYAILDLDGKPLVTSNMPDKKARGGSSNIGYPSAMKEVDHFVAMIRQTAPRLPAEKLEELKKALLKK
jgi:uncharacterized GH25 family protein/thiol-disulfide isomerase/thioredoxin